MLKSPVIIRRVLTTRVFTGSGTYLLAVPAVHRVLGVAVQRLPPRHERGQGRPRLACGHGAAVRVEPPAQFSSGRGPCATTRSCFWLLTSTAGREANKP
jgi:hypothetical protein